MRKYRYNALDIAAYFKWSTVPSEMELVYLDLLFQMRESILARPLTKSLEFFSREVFCEMYHVWARGFENEFSDVNLIADEDCMALICDQEFLALELYMKLLALHLILAENLPYIRINFMGLPLLLGIEGDFKDFEGNLVKVMNALQLISKDYSGQPIDLSKGIPSEPLCISLSDPFRQKLFGSTGYRIRRVNDSQTKMKQLQDKSRLVQEAYEQLASTVSRNRRGAFPLENSRISVSVMPAGSPIPPNPVTIESTNMLELSSASTKEVESTKTAEIITDPLPNKSRNRKGERNANPSK